MKFLELFCSHFLSDLFVFVNLGHFKSRKTGRMKIYVSWEETDEVTTEPLSDIEADVPDMVNEYFDNL